MLSVATLVVIISAIAFVEGLNAIITSSDGFVLFSASLTLLLSTSLGIVGLLWWCGCFGMPAAPYLLPADVLTSTWQKLRTAYHL